MVTPGTYLRMRREAACLSIDDVAQRIVAPWGKLHLSARWIYEVEADRLAAEDASLQRLRTAFQFDPYIYRQLAAGLATPTLCRVCACSWMDACLDDREMPCSWVKSEPDLCTACVDKPAAAPAAAALGTAEPTSFIQPHA
jgi:hypothetical protein